METLLSLLQSTIGTDQARQLVLFLLFLPLFAFAYWAVKRGMVISLRAIPGYAALTQLLTQSAETGRPVHLSLGISGIADAFTADTMAGLTTLEYVAERGVISEAPPIVTVANPTALPAAQDVLRRTYTRHGYAEEYDPARARFIAPNGALNSATPVAPGSGFAYAAGAMQTLTQHKLTANVMLGRFGDEFLLLGETGAQRGLPQVGGTSAERVLPFVQSTVDNPLLGEEIYASGAYLLKKPAHLSSLLAQDIARGLLVLGIIVAVLMKTIGLF
ncbi:MAG: hypothetical protein HY868_15315 [Chloroflexi bacterium]|nr:hypothetical protein [Chloroflexota bacterium]